jgi:hypothetical protein
MALRKDRCNVRTYKISANAYVNLDAKIRAAQCDGERIGVGVCT